METKQIRAAQLLRKNARPPVGEFIVAGDNFRVAMKNCVIRPRDRFVQESAKRQVPLVILEKLCHRYRLRLASSLPIVDLIRGWVLTKGSLVGIDHGLAPNPG